jgi:hypothetical protein
VSSVEGPPGRTSGRASREGFGIHWRVVGDAQADISSIYGVHDGEVTTEFGLASMLELGGGGLAVQAGCEDGGYEGRQDGVACFR